jgi:predicted alpha/beta hydrolase
MNTGASALSLLDVTTKDGVVLRASVREPVGAPVGVAILAHAMFARRSEWERPKGKGVAEFLASEGWRTVAFDFRGHGDSGTPAKQGGSWSYDDLVVHDLPAMVDDARTRWPELPIVVVGHSLGGHVALASHAIGKCSFDGVVMAATNVWLKDVEPSRARWIMKRGSVALMNTIARVYGRFPARKFKMGSDDESLEYFAAVARVPRINSWTNDDGSVDYRAAVSRCTLPALAIASDGDTLNCPPACAERFLGIASGPHVFDRITRADDGGPAPGHMEIVTSLAARSAWVRAAKWMSAIARS